MLRFFRFASASITPLRRRVFVDSVFAGVGHRHDDERLDQTLTREPLRGFVGAPFDSAKGSRGVENILAIVQIKHRVTPLRRAPVAGRQIDEHVALIAQHARGKAPVFLDVPGQGVFLLSFVSHAVLSIDHLIRARNHSGTPLFSIFLMAK